MLGGGVRAARSGREGGMMCVCMSIRKREEREGEGDEGVEAGQQGWRRSLVAAGAMVIFWVVFSFSSEVVGCVLRGEGLLW